MEWSVVEWSGEEWTGVELSGMGMESNGMERMKKVYQWLVDYTFIVSDPESSEKRKR